MSRDRAFLGHMLQALERVSTLAAEISEGELASDWKKQNALIRELEVLGEAAGRVSTDFVAAHPEIPWKEITGLRHKLIHDYFEVDPQECHARRIAFRRAWLAELADEVAQGTLTVVKNTGHFIQNDDPELVVWSIRRVLDAEPPRVAVSLARSALEEYVGFYEGRPQTGFTVTLEGDHLFAQYTGQNALPIFAESAADFYYRAVDARLSFHRYATGVVTRLVLRQNGRDTPFERVR